jgi:hypothetical protein
MCRNGIDFFDQHKASTGMATIDAPDRCLTRDSAAEHAGSATHSAKSERL